MLELQEAHRHFQTPNGAANPVIVGDIVIVHDENHPRGLWKLGKVEELIQGTDENVTGAFVWVHSRRNHSGILKRSIQWLYPLKVREVMDSEEIADSNNDNAQHQVRPVASTSETDSPRSDTLVRPSSTGVSVEPPHQENWQPRRQVFLRA